MPKVVPGYQKEAKKRILQAALEVFEERGYYGSTMDNVAEKLNISKGAIYQYFSSKHQLLGELYASGPENLKSMFLTTAGLSVVDASKEVFNRMVTKSFASLWVVFLAEASKNPDLRKTIRDNIDGFNDVLEELLKKNTPNMGRKELDQAHRSAVILGLLFNGLVSWVAVGIPETEVRKVWEDSIEILSSAFGLKA